MESFQLILSLIEGTNDMIHSVMADGSFEFVNRAWMEILGYIDGDIKKLRLENIIYVGHMKSHQELVEDILKGESRTGVEVTFVTKDGAMVHVEGNLFPHREGSKIISATGFFRDVTERKETEEQLKEARSRTEFLVDLMVHDLTNINQEILSTFEVLLYNPSLPVQLADLVREGLAEVDRSSGLITNVRKISRLSSRVPETTIWDLATVIQEATDLVRKSFADKNLSLDITQGKGQYNIVADEFLKDVFFSILHNSMKFEKGQKVRIEIVIEEMKHTPFLRIQIRDQGPGIPDEEKEEVFERLSPERESILGRGLGLTLVKKILENYGGLIHVEDRVEGDYSKGANFIILLRYQSKGVGVEE